MRKKVGVLTFHKCINYGSYWQAHFLVHAIRSKGYEATILNYTSAAIDIAEWKCAMQPQLPAKTSSSEISHYRRKIENSFKCIEALPMSEQFPLNDSPLQHYDTIVVGSDEVWNLFHPWYGKSALFFGEKLRPERLVSYAASFGNYPAEFGLEDMWAKRLQNFDFISVRDENSRLLVKNATGIDPDLVLDPCLQYLAEPAFQREHELTERYIAVYGHSFSDVFIHHVRSFAKAKRLKLVSIGYKNAWADVQRIDADPFDFLQLMKRSEAVATNFFHGCVFALRYQKPFVCETSPYRITKIQCLLRSVEADKHLLSSSNYRQVFDCLNEQPQQQIKENIEQLRKVSALYLDKALNLNQLKVA